MWARRFAFVVKICSIQNQKVDLHTAHTENDTSTETLLRIILKLLFTNYFYFVLFRNVQPLMQATLMAENEKTL